MSDLLSEFDNIKTPGAPKPAQNTSLVDQFDATQAPGATPVAAPKPYSPLDDMSMSQRLMAAVGRGMTSGGRALLQGFSKLVGADDVGEGLVKQSDVDYANQLDAPLMQTRAGKIGSAVGTAAVALPTTLIPGANTYLGATLVGGGTGLATTEGDMSDRLHGAAWGAAGGAAGKALGDLIGAGVRKLAADRAASVATQAAQNAQRTDAINLARQYGYKLPPMEVNPGPINATLQGVSGKIKTAQAASQFNQDVTNRAVRSALGMAEDAPITRDALIAIRKQAGDAYDAIGSTGTVTPGQSYLDAIDKIAKQANGQAKSFPGLKNDQISEVLHTLKQTSFDAADAVDATKFLRNLSDKAYASGDKAAASAYKSASGALEDALETHMQSLGNPDALAAFRSARQTIAKTYTVEKALNPSSGNVDAAKLAAQLNRGKPLSGELKDVATIANNFKDSTKSLSQNYNPSSPLDWAAAMMGQAGKAAMLVPLARPAIRSVILSQPAQALNARMATSQFDPLLSGVYPALGSRPLRDLLTAGAAGAAIQGSK